MGCYKIDFDQNSRSIRKNELVKEQLKVLNKLYRVVKEKRKRNYEPIDENVRLQMIQLFAWSVIEKYITFKFNLSIDIHQKIKEFYKSKETHRVFDKVIKYFKENERDIFEYFENLNKVEKRDEAPQSNIYKAYSFKNEGRLDINNPQKFIQGLYTMRCNLTHRGKEYFSRDTDLLRNTTPILIELANELTTNN